MGEREKEERSQTTHGRTRDADGDFERRRNERERLPGRYLRHGWRQNDRAELILKQIFSARLRGLPRTCAPIAASAEPPKVVHRASFQAHSRFVSGGEARAHRLRVWSIQR